MVCVDETLLLSKKILLMQAMELCLAVCELESLEEDHMGGRGRDLVPSKRYHRC